MSEESGARRRLKAALAVAAFYTFLTLLFIPQVYFYNSAAARPVPWGLAVGRLAPANYIWAALTPLVFCLGECVPVERPRVVRNLALHFPLSLAFAAAQTLAYHALLGAYLGGAWASVAGVVRNPGYFLNFVTNGFVVYAGILAFNQAVGYSRKYRDREFRLQQAQLQALRTQLHPHFLFNTLNAVAPLIHEDPRAADRVVTQLSDLLRLSLAGGQAQEVTLKEELDFLRKYVEIQRTLLQERLDVSFRIEPDALDASGGHGRGRGARGAEVPQPLGASGRRRRRRVEDARALREVRLGRGLRRRREARAGCRRAAALMSGPGRRDVSPCAPPPRATDMMRSTTKSEGYLPPPRSPPVTLDGLVTSFEMFPSRRRRPRCF